MSLAHQIVPAGEGKGEPISTGEYRKIALADIRLDQAAQPRESLNTDKTAEYAEAMKAGDKFPSLVVFEDASGIWLADGFHRHYAAQQAGITSLSCRVMPGGLRDAILFSVGANATHGVPRSDADKERAVKRLLADDEWSQWSDREIARRCKVDHKTVARIRKAASGEAPQIERKVRRGDTVYTQKVAKAAAQNAPKALANDEPSPEAGPQAEASLVGTDTGTPADREGRSEGEAASVDLPTVSDAVGHADAIQSPWDCAGAEGKALFMARNNLQFISEEPTARPEATVNPVAHVRTPAPAKSSAQGPSEAEGSGAAHGPQGSPVVPPIQQLSPADRIRLLRPHCAHPDDLSQCAGVGRKHCHACAATIEPEAA